MAEGRYAMNSGRVAHRAGACIVNGEVDPSVEGYNNGWSFNTNDKPYYPAPPAGQGITNINEGDLVFSTLRQQGESYMLKMRSSLAGMGVPDNVFSNFDDPETEKAIRAVIRSQIAFGGVCVGGYNAETDNIAQGITYSVAGIATIGKYSNEYQIQVGTTVYADLPRRNARHAKFTKSGAPIIKYGLVPVPSRKVSKSQDLLAHFNKYLESPGDWETAMMKSDKTNVWANIIHAFGSTALVWLAAGLKVLEDAGKVEIPGGFDTLVSKLGLTGERDQVLQARVLKAIFYNGSSSSSHAIYPITSQGELGSSKGKLVEMQRNALETLVGAVYAELEEYNRFLIGKCTAVDHNSIDVNLCRFTP